MMHIEPLYGLIDYKFKLYNSCFVIAEDELYRYMYIACIACLNSYKLTMHATHA